MNLRKMLILCLIIFSLLSIFVWKIGSGFISDFKEKREQFIYKQNHLVFEDSLSNIEKNVEELYFLFNKLPNGDIGKNCFIDFYGNLVINNENVLKVDSHVIKRVHDLELSFGLTKWEMYRMIRILQYLKKNHIEAMVSNNYLGTIRFDYRNTLSGRPEDYRWMVFIKYDSLDIYPNWKTDEWRQLDRKDYLVLYALREGEIKRGFKF